MDVPKLQPLLKKLFLLIFRRRQSQIYLSILIDASNDKVDKSCIILVRFLDPEVGNVCTRFLDMPVVNIGTAQNLFSALKESLNKQGLDFAKAVYLHV